MAAGERALPKFMEAVEVLVGEGAQAQRVRGAYLVIATLRDDDFPTRVLPLVRELRDAEGRPSDAAPIFLRICWALLQG